MKIQDDPSVSNVIMWWIILQLIASSDFKCFRTEPVESRSDQWCQWSGSKGEPCVWVNSKHVRYPRLWQWKYGELIFSTINHGILMRVSHFRPHWMVGSCWREPPSCSSPPATRESASSMNEPCSLGSRAWLSCRQLRWTKGPMERTVFALFFG